MLEYLSNCWQTHQSPKDQPTDIEPVRRGDFEGGFDKKRVDLDDLIDDHHYYADEVSFDASEGFPSNSDPISGRKLEHASLDPFPIRHISPRATPVVLLHFEIPADLHSDVDSDTVAEEHVKHPLIPPAFFKVREDLDVEQLGELPKYRHDPCERVGAEHEALGDPAKKMTQNELVDARKNILHLELAWES